MDKRHSHFVRLKRHCNAHRPGPPLVHGAAAICQMVLCGQKTSLTGSTNVCRAALGASIKSKPGPRDMEHGRIQCTAHGRIQCSVVAILPIYNITGPETWPMTQQYALSHDSIIDVNEMMHIKDSSASATLGDDDGVGLACTSMTVTNGLNTTFTSSTTCRHCATVTDLRPRPWFEFLAMKGPSGSDPMHTVQT